MPIAESEKERRRALLKKHYDVENQHDMDAIMETFAPEGEMIYNRIPFGDPESIRGAHLRIGFAGEGGGFKGIVNHIDGEHFTADEIVVEGRLCGQHVGEFQGVEATVNN